MRVKVGDIWYSTNEQPIAVELNDGERKQIADMIPADKEVGYRRYSQYRIDKMSPREADEWMRK